MKKMILVASTVATLAVTPFASGAFAAAEDQPEHHWQYSAEDAKAFVDARIAALKAGLELTPAQEKNWAPVEAAIRDQAKQRAERFAAWREKRKEQKGERPDPLERMQRFSEILAARADNLKALAQVSKPLYDSLDDAQKRRFGRLMMASLWGRHQGAWGEHHWRHADAEGLDGDPAK